MPFSLNRTIGEKLSRLSRLAMATSNKLAMQDVDTAGDDDPSADNGPGIRHIVPNKITEQGGPHDSGVPERRCNRCLCITEGFNHRVVPNKDERHARDRGERLDAREARAAKKKADVERRLASLPPRPRAQARPPRLPPTLAPYRSPAENPARGAGCPQR